MMDAGHFEHNEDAPQLSGVEHDEDSFEKEMERLRSRLASVTLQATRIERLCSLRGAVLLDALACLDVSTQPEAALVGMKVRAALAGERLRKSAPGVPSMSRCRLATVDKPPRDQRGPHGARYSVPVLAWSADGCLYSFLLAWDYDHSGWVSTSRHGPNADDFGYEVASWQLPPRQRAPIPTPADNAPND